VERADIPGVSRAAIVDRGEGRPFYPLYLNPLGLGRAGYYFPHDESADAGLRPTILKICKEAAAGSTVGGEAPPVFAYYFHQCGRDDLHYFSLSDAHRETLSPSTYLVVQDGRNISRIFPSFKQLHPAKPRRGPPQSRGFRPRQFIELRNWRN